MPAAQVIPFERACLHIKAARTMEQAAPGAPPRTAESLRQLARDFRERARGYPPMRG